MGGIRKLDHPGVRDYLIAQLALGGVTQAALGAQYGVGQDAISKFAARWADAIAERKAADHAEFHGQWIADKRARLATLEEQAEKIYELFARLSPEDDAGRIEDDAGDIDGEALVRASKELRAILRAVAEELGQLPVRATLGYADEPLRVIIEGVDMDAV